MTIVRFLVKETGKIVEKTFHSPWKANNFVNKLKYSKRLILLATITE